MTRSARDPVTGETVKVPADMNYKEWDEWQKDGAPADIQGWRNGRVGANVDGEQPVGANNETGGDDVDIHSIGRIDKDIYKNVNAGLMTDEVIITEKQIQHVIDRHGQDYDAVVNRLQEIVSAPDYIFADKRPSTAMVVKSLDDGNGVVILRLAISSDPAEYKNSIITFMKINEARLQNYLRNRKILYRKSQ